MLLKEEVTRYQLVLQLRRDLLHGRLHSPNQSDIATLSSYIVQCKLTIDSYPTCYIVDVSEWPQNV